MKAGSRWLIATSALAASSSAALAQSRSGENAVTQAEDAFGFSIGRESLGIYTASDVRGFSPSAAGNLRIDGLYFDEAYPLQSTLLGSTSIKVGLTAQGYPFAAPSGIVDKSLRLPEARAGASVVTNADSFGTLGLEVDGSLPISQTLSIGYGIAGNRGQRPDGTSNWSHTVSVAARWRPRAGIEIIPFWAMDNDYDDEAPTYYVPAGAFLPKLPTAARNDGPDWADNRYTGINLGVLASARIAENWLLRAAAFRSVNDVKRGFTALLADEQPDGRGERLLFVDPPTKSAATSGELRLTHSILDGPRLHVVHLSVRRRSERAEFGGSDVLDFGPGQIGTKVTDPEPDAFHFSELSRDGVDQTTAGAAYDGRWKDVGEISFGISKTHFRKETAIPDVPVAVTRSAPLLYNATAAAELTPSVTVYAGYARGLEGSGVAPPNAANRNEPLPVILTEQKDGGVRIQLTRGIKAVAGLFDLSRPYFGLDASQVYKQVGAVRDRGAEFSLSGSVTPRLSVVAGGILFKPRVNAAAATAGNIGSRPVGVPTHLLMANANWKTSFARGLELDVAFLHRGRMAATTDNLVFIPPRARVDLGTHYRFRLAKRSATLRVQLLNLFDNPGYGRVGSGIYGQLPGRYVQGYLAVDL
jgi:iron complex outermembrane receptor protein